MCRNILYLAIALLKLHSVRILCANTQLSTSYKFSIRICRALLNLIIFVKSLVIVLLGPDLVQSSLTIWVKVLHWGLFSTQNITLGFDFLSEWKIAILTLFKLFVWPFLVVSLYLAFLIFGCEILVRNLWCIILDLIRFFGVHVFLFGTLFGIFNFCPSRTLWAKNWFFIISDFCVSNLIFIFLVICRKFTKIWRRLHIFTEIRLDIDAYFTYLSFLT